jgi:O-methyltransferase
MTNTADHDEVVTSTELRRMYLDLLKRALTHTLYWPLDLYWSTDFESPEMREAVQQAFARGEVDLRQMRDEGRDWPRFGQTMVGAHRLENVQACVERVLAEGVPGDLIEAGAWRGGVSIFMRGVLKAYGITDRTVFAADSFRGLPPPNPEEYPADTADQHHTADMLIVSREDVEQNFRLYDLLDGQVAFLEGWFRDTLPTVRDRTWAVVRIDGDMYESTMDALVNLYPRLSPGGYVIIDDFAYDPCRKAVADFRCAQKIDEPIERIDWTGVFWRRRG